MFYIWKVFDRRKSKIKCLSVITFVFFIAGFLLLDCFCSDKKCSWSSSVSSETRIEPSFKSLNHLSAVNNFSEEDLDKHFEFNPDTDVFVFLHIQKTGGTNFGLNLVKNTSFKEPCVCFENRKRCDCRTSRNYLWLISRHSTGWVCGLHADWTELHDCVPGYLNRVDGFPRKRRYFYFAILRDPLQRYLSEWKHVQRGSTWVTAKLKCGGRKATREEVPLCFKGKNWMGVTLDEFTTCESNLAHNRQTRMTADLRLVGCYDKTVIPNVSIRNKIMLQSAKDNLRSMAFFGLTEYQSESSFLFEYTFGIKFTTNFTQFNETRASKAEISIPEREELLQLNSLDVELYSYAKDLFLARVLYAKMQLKYGKKMQERSEFEKMFQQQQQQHTQVDALLAGNQPSAVTTLQDLPRYSSPSPPPPPPPHQHNVYDAYLNYKPDFSKSAAKTFDGKNRSESAHNEYDLTDTGYDYNNINDDNEEDDNEDDNEEDGTHYLHVDNKYDAGKSDLRNIDNSFREAAEVHRQTDHGDEPGDVPPDEAGNDVVRPDPNTTRR